MPKDVGLRYLLPALALGGRRGLRARRGVAAGKARMRGRWEVTPAVRRGGHGRALVLALASRAGPLPDSIAWTAWPFRPNYTVATDSNVDWGQGLYALRSWSASRDPWVGYFGPRGITTADIPGARPLLGAPPGHVSGGSPCR